MPFQIWIGGEEEREREGESEREKRKEKEKLQPWLVKFQLISIQCMGVHVDSTPYNNCTRNMLW